MINHKHKKYVKHIRSRGIYALMGLVTMATVVMATTRAASAATISVTSPSAVCPSLNEADGDYALISPYVDSDGTKYYCIQGLKIPPDRVTAATRSRVMWVCPANIPMVHSAFGGFLCLTLSNPTVKSAPVIPTGDSSWHTDICGSTTDPDQPPIQVSIKLGCKHRGNPILDALFAIVRFLTFGVGMVIVASTVVAGIQYSASRGDPNATAKAIERVRNNLIALLIFIFAFPIINWLIPAGLLH